MLCWGSNSSSQITVPEFPTNFGLVTQVSAGGSHACAVTEVGYVRCWGSNSKHQTQVPAETFFSVSSTSLYGQLPSTRVIHVGLGRITGELTLGSVVSADFEHEFDGDIGYQWLRDGVVIPGATGSSYQITDLDLGKKLKVTLVQTEGAYVTYYATWPTYVDFPFVSSAVPSITGEKSVGNKLNVGFDGWGDGVAFSCQWLRDGKTIDSNGCDYSITLFDLGKRLSVRVTGSKDRHNSVTRTSAAYTIDTISGSIPNSLCKGSFDEPPWIGNNLQPQILGTGKYGTTLTGSTGAWPGGTAFCTLWLKDDFEIIQAANKNYKVKASDINHNFRYVVVGADSKGQSKVRYSPPIAAALGDLAPASTPAILGQPKYPSKVTASFKPWASGVKLTYQWISDGKFIANANSVSLSLPVTAIGKRLSLRLCGEKTYYEPKCTTSKSIIVADGRKEQAQLKIVASATSTLEGKMVDLSSVGGSGLGSVTFVTAGSDCQINETAVTSISASSCVVYALKDGDKKFKQKRSNSIEIEFRAKPPEYEIKDISGAGRISCPVGTTMISSGVGNVPIAIWRDMFGNPKQSVTVYSVTGLNQLLNGVSATGKFVTYQSQWNGDFLAPNGSKYFAIRGGPYVVPVWVKCGGYW